MANAGRNDRCPCGSGRKHKHCCAGKTSAAGSYRVVLLLVGAALLAAILAAVSNSRRGSSSPGRVWSAEHGHYHDATGREIPR